MLSIPCPWCGPRDETEFRNGGEAGVAHPPDPEALDDARWAAYVFVRANGAGRWRERWFHAAGCRRWFALERDVTTNAIATPEPAPEPPAGTAGR